MGEKLGRAAVRVQVHVARIGASYMREELIDVDLRETCPAEDYEVDRKIEALGGEAVHRATIQTASVFPAPVEEPEEVGVDE